MAVAESRHGIDHPRLHVRERLTTREGKPARVTLHGHPFRQLHQLLELGAGPVAEVAFDEPAVDTRPETERPSDRCCCLPRPFERRAIDGGHVGDFQDPASGLRRLVTALIGEMQSTGAPRKHGTRRRRLAMPDEEDDGEGWR